MTHFARCRYAARVASFTAFFMDSDDAICQDISYCCLLRHYRCDDFSAALLARCCCRFDAVLPSAARPQRSRRWLALIFSPAAHHATPAYAITYSPRRMICFRAMPRRAIFMPIYMMGIFMACAIRCPALFFRPCATYAR